jgi:hypothetical protein
MLINLDLMASSEKSASYEMRVDDNLLGFAMVAAENKLEAGDYRVAVGNLQKYGGELVPFIVGTDIAFHDGDYEDGGIVVGGMVSDNIIINSRPMLAKLLNAVMYAIDNLDIIELEIS